MSCLQPKNNWIGFLIIILLIISHFDTKAFSDNVFSSEKSLVNEDLVLVDAFMPEERCYGYYEATLFVINTGDNDVFLTEWQIDFESHDISYFEDQEFTFTSYSSDAIPAGEDVVEIQIGFELPLTRHHFEVSVTCLMINYEDIVSAEYLIEDDFTLGGFEGTIYRDKDNYYVSPDSEPLVNFSPFNACGNIHLIYLPESETNQYEYQMVVGLPMNGFNLTVEGYGDNVVFGLQCTCSASDCPVLTLKNITVADINPGNPGGYLEGESDLRVGSADLAILENVTILEPEGSIDAGSENALEIFNCENVILNDCHFECSERAIFCENVFQSLSLNNCEISSLDQSIDCRLDHFYMDNCFIQAVYEAIDLELYESLTIQQSTIVEDPDAVQVFSNEAFVSIYCPGQCWWDHDETDFVIENNFFRVDDTHTFISISTSYTVRNNTFIGAGNPVTFYGYGGNYIGTNIFTNNVVNAYDKRIYLPSYFSSPEVTTISDYNCYYSTYSNPFNIGQYSDFSVLLEDIQRDYGIEQHSIWFPAVIDEDNPTRLKSGTPNYPLFGMSSADLGTNTDIFGTERNDTNISCGAEELGSEQIDLDIIHVLTNDRCAGAKNYYARIINMGREDALSFDVQWEAQGISQPTVIVDEPISYGDTLDVFLGTLDFFELTEVIINANITNVTGGEEVLIENNTFSGETLIASYSNPVHIGENQDFETWNDFKDYIWEFGGVCGSLEIIFHPGEYNVDGLHNTPNFLSTSSVPHSLMVRSSSGIAEDVVLIDSTGVTTFSNFENVHFEDLTFLNDYVALQNRKSKTLKVSNCVFQGKILSTGRQHGMESIEIDSCIFLNNQAPHAFSYSQDSEYDNRYLDSLIFTNNQVLNDSIEGGKGGGVFADENVLNIDISNNYFDCVGSHAAYIEDIASLNFENNIVYNGWTSGLQLLGASANSYRENTSNYQVKNNYFHSFLEDQPAYVSSNSIVTTLELIFDHNTVRGSSEYGLRFDASLLKGGNNLFENQHLRFEDLANPGTDFNHNIYSTDEAFPFEFNTDTDLTFEEWKLLTNADSLSIIHPVLFEDSVGYQLNDPIADGNAFGIAESGVADFDIEGNERDSEHPDVGCYEFDPMDLPFDVVIAEASIVSLDCAAPTTGWLEVINNGTDTIHYIEASYTFNDPTPIEFNNLNFAPNDTIQLDIVDIIPPHQGPMEVLFDVISVNDTIDFNQENSHYSFPFEGYALSGNVYVGDSPFADFQDLIALFSHLNSFGYCDDLNILILPGTYQFPSDFQLEDDETYLKKVGSLNLDQNTVIIEAETDLILDGFTNWEFENLTFRTTENGDCRFQNGANTSFTNCYFESPSSPAFEVETSSGLFFENCLLNETIKLSESSQISLINGIVEGSVLATNVIDLSIIGNEINYEGMAVYAHGLSITGNTTNIDIQRNLVVGNFDVGILIEDMCNCEDDEERQLINNISEISGNGETLIINSNAPLKVYHNTLINVNSPSFRHVNSNFETHIDNNVFVSTNSESVVLENPSILGSFDNNVIFSQEDVEVAGFMNVELLNLSETLNANENIGLDPMLQAITYSISNSDVASFGKNLGIPFDFNLISRDLLAPMSGAVEPFNSTAEILTGDIDGDGVVDTSDLLLILGNWGCTSECGDLDLDGDGVVSVGDLLIVLQGYSVI